MLESAQAGAYVYHPLVEPQRVAESGDEPVVGVELRGLVIDDVHYDEPGSGGLVVARMAPLANLQVVVPINW